MFRSCIFNRTTRHALAQTQSSNLIFIRTLFPSPPRQKQKKKNQKPAQPGPTEEMWARIKPTAFTVFHNPDDSSSRHVLRVLQAAILEYPKPPRNPDAPRAFYQYRGPLNLTLNVLERLPTVDEFHLLLPLRPLPSFMSFLNTTALRETPMNAQALVDILTHRPEVLDWPVVVDWEHGESALGKKGYLQLLKAVSRRRAKVLRSPPAHAEPPAASPPAEWIDYD
ncbi:hypothetical protein B0H19DRAFT_1311024 [Mycena capillaripes]|nr:hypothetical protein B0H19DRAFT_1311024 [Mycena capillaripes]